MFMRQLGEMPQQLQLPPRQPAGRRGWKQTPQLCRKVPEPWFVFFIPCFRFVFHAGLERQGSDRATWAGGADCILLRDKARLQAASRMPHQHQHDVGWAALLGWSCPLPSRQLVLTVPARRAGCALKSRCQQDQAQHPERHGSSKPKGVGTEPGGHWAAGVLASMVHMPRESGRMQHLYFSLGANLSLPCNTPVPRLRGCSRDLSAPAGAGGQLDEDCRDQNQQAESCLLPVPLPHLPEDVSRAKARQAQQETLTNHSTCVARTLAQPFPDPSRRKGIALTSP